MATLTFYLHDARGPSGFDLLRQTTAAAATSSTGWTVGTGATLRSQMQAGSERNSGTFDSTAYPPAALDLALQDAMRTEDLLTGTFASGNWTLNFVVRAVTSGGAQDGRIYFRLWKADADGNNAVEITSAAQACAIVSNVSTSADFNSSLTFNPGAFTITNQALFFQVAWERTGAGGMTNADVLFRTGSSSTVGTRITTADFAVPPSAPTANAASNITGTSFQANWSSSSGATGYRLDVATDSGFSSFVSGYNNLDVGLTTLRTVSGLTAATDYWYRVRAYNASGTSGSSNTITLTTLGPPAAPTATPATSLLGTSFRANVEPALTGSAPTSYRIDVDTRADFGGAATGGNVLSDVSTANEYYDVTGLSRANTYYYRWRGVNTNGTSSNSATITTVTPSVAIRFLEPGSDATFTNTGLFDSSAISGSVTSSTDVAITGPRTFKCETTANNQSATLIYTASMAPTARASWRVRWSTTPTEARGIFALPSAPWFQLDLNTSMQLQGRINNTPVARTSSALSLNTTYRLAVAMNVVSTTNFTFKVFVNGALALTFTQADGTLASTTIQGCSFGWFSGSTSTATTQTMYLDDVYIDDGDDLGDPGDIRVTAKLPASENVSNWNDATAAGSRVGKVAQRPLTEATTADYLTNTAASDLAENFTLQSASAGDVDISGSTIIGYMGWARYKVASTVGVRPDLTINGVDYRQNPTAVNTFQFLTEARTSASYPSGAAGIGMRSSTIFNDTLAEAGVVVAYTVPAAFTPKQGSWRWYTDSATDGGMSALAAENTSPTLTGAQVQNTVLRLRVQISETGGGAGTTGALGLQYSQDGTNWKDVDAQAAADKGVWFRYANGAATAGATIGTRLLTGSTSSGTYHESSAGTESVAGSAVHEVDFALLSHWPPPSIVGLQFRITSGGTPLALASGASALTLNTSSPSDRPYTVSYLPPQSGSTSDPQSFWFGANRRVFYDGARWWLFYVDYPNNTAFKYHYWDGTGAWSAATNTGVSISSRGPRNQNYMRVLGGTPVVFSAGIPSSGTIKFKRGTVSGTTISWSTEQDAGTSAANYGAVTCDDGGFWWFGYLQLSTGVTVRRATNADTGGAWTNGWQADRSVADATATAFSPLSLIPLGSDKVMALWWASGSQKVKAAVATNAGGFGAVTTVSDVGTASVSNRDDWCAVRSGDYVYVVHTTSASPGAGSWRLKVYQISTDTWSAGPSPNISMTTGSSDFSPITYDQTNNKLYLFRTGNGPEGGEDRTLDYETYSGPGPSGTWDNNVTNLAPGGRGNLDAISASESAAGGKVVVIGTFGDDHLEGSGFATEYYTITVGGGASTIERAYAAGASIATQATKTFSAGAPVQTTRATTYGAGALLQATLTKPYASAALVQATLARSYGAGALLQATSTKTVSAAAAVQSTRSAAYGAGALLVSTQERAYSASATLARVATQPFAASAPVQGARSAAYPSGAALNLDRATSVSAAAPLQGTREAAYAAGAVLLLERGAPYAAAAPVQAALTTPYTASGPVQGTRASAYAAAAPLLATTERAHSAAASVQGDLTHVYAAGAPLVAALERAYSAASLLQSTPEAAYSASAPLAQDSALSASAGAAVQGEREAPAVAASLLARDQSRTYSAGAPLQSTVDGAYAAGSLLLSERVHSYAAAGLVQGDFTRGASSAALLQAERTLAYAAGALLSGAGAAPYSASASVARELTLPYSSGAAVQATLERAIGASASLNLDRALSYGAALPVQAELEWAYAAGASLQANRTRPLSAGATLLSEREAPYAAGATLLAEREGAYAASAPVAQESAQPFSASVAVQAAREGAYAAGAALHYDRVAPHSAAAAVLGVRGDQFAAGARLSGAFEAAYAATGLLQAELERAYSASGSVAAEVHAPYGVSGSVSQERGAAYGTGGVVFSEAERAYSASALLQAGYVAPHSAGALLQASLSLAYSAALPVRGDLVAPYSAAAPVQFTVQGAYAGGASVLAEREGAYSGGAALLADRASAYSVASWLQGAFEQTIAAGATLQGERARAYGAGATLQVERASPYAAASALALERTAPHVVGALLQAEREGAFGVGVLIALEREGAYSAASLLLSERETPYAAGASLARDFALSYGAALAVQAQREGVYSAGAVLQEGREAPYSAAASLARQLEWAYSAAVAVLAEREGAYAAGAALLAADQVVATYSAGASVLGELARAYAAGAPVQGERASAFGAGYTLTAAQDLGHAYSAGARIEYFVDPAAAPFHYLDWNVAWGGIGEVYLEPFPYSFPDEATTPYGKYLDDTTIPAAKSLDEATTPYGKYLDDATIPY